MAKIHPSAIVDRHAEVANDVEVGPYCIIGAGVRIGEATRLLSHVVVTGRTSIGKNNVIHPFAAIGGEAQMRKAPSPRRFAPSAAPEARTSGPREPSRETLAIGDDNVVREHVTIHVSTGEHATTIGSHNLLMVGCHVAHDVIIGSHCVVANGVQLAGHVVVEDYAVFGGLAGVAQWRRIGQSAFVAAGAMCERDVPPFVIVQGDRARVRALNVVGLERRGVPAESIVKLRRAFTAAFVRHEKQLDTADAWVKILSDFLGRG